MKVTSSHNQNCGESAWGEWKVCWGVGRDERSFGKRYGGCGGRCREVCWGVGGGKERCVGSGEVWGGVWESVWGEWGSVLACGERMWGEEWGRCRKVY